MPQEALTEMTRLLDAAGRGDRAASDALLPLLYDELRKLAWRQLANEPAGLTLQPTALVHEAYMRLGGGQELRWENRRHFFGAAALAMRRILVERARQCAGPKRGGDRERLALEQTPTPIIEVDRLDWIALNDALEALERHDRELFDVVSLRYFAGLSVDETAAALGISPSTVDRSWRGAKAFLLWHMEGSADVSQ